MKSLRTLLFGLILAVCASPPVFGQSNPGLVYGQVPSAAQWNSYFSAKQDVLGFPPVNKNGDVMQGELTTIASGTGGAGFNLIPGVAPTSPVNGDMWMTAAGLYIRANGSTVGPIGNVNTTSPLSINLNSSALIPSQTGAIFQGQQADGVVARSELDAFGAIASFSGVIAGGTAASPTAVVANQQLTGINAYAYNGSAYVGPIASFRTYAGENISSGHQGSYACVATTPNASTTSANQLCIYGDGGIVVGSPTGGDQGAGTINVSSAYYVNGGGIGLSAIAANSVLANFTAGSAVPIANAISACGDATHALKYTAATGFGCQAITASATAGGSNTQVQYNNSSALGGISGVTSNGTTMTFASTDLIATNVVVSGQTLTFPSAADTVVARATTDTLTNKTISGASNTLSAIALSSLASQAADTVLLNATGGSAAPTAVAMPTSGTNGCSGVADALSYNTSTHTLGCTTIAGGSGSPGGASGTLQYNNSGSFGAVTNSSVSGSEIELGAAIAPTNSLTIGSTGTGIKLFNTVAQVTNTEDAYMSWGTNVFTIGTENAGTGSAHSMTLSAVGTLTLKSTAAMPISIGGATAFSVYSNAIVASNGSGPWLQNASSGLTTPTLIPNQGSTSTGIGGTSGLLSIIASGTEVVHLTSTGTTFNTDVFTKQASAPTVTSCGAGPTIAAGSTDTAGKVTEGSSGGSTSCTVTFATVKAVAPFCTVSYGSGAGGTLAVSTSTTGVSIITGSAISSQTWFYICVQHS